MRGLFTQERVAASAGLFLDGLLGDERRKTGWMRAEAAGDAGRWPQQAILGRGRWDADALRDIVRDYVVETLARRREAIGRRQLRGIDDMPQQETLLLGRGGKDHGAHPRYRLVRAA